LFLSPELRQPANLEAQTSEPAALDLSLNDLSGKPVSLERYRGKIVVMNFWATWCFPCREEMPMLNKLAPVYAEKNTVFLAISLDDSATQPKIPKFLGKKKIVLPVFIDATPVTLHQLGLGEAIPATLILDRNGVPAFRILGEASKKDVASRLEWLLSDRSGKSPKPFIKNL
jgi:thiol-disulfide isomerase/thioredoxin